MFMLPVPADGVLDAPVVVELPQDTDAILGLVENVSVTDAVPIPLGAAKISEGPAFDTMMV